MTYVSGGSGISGGSGLLHVYMSGAKGKKTKYEFPMQFKAVAAGNGAISISDAVSYTHLDVYKRQK